MNIFAKTVFVGLISAATLSSNAAMAACAVGTGGTTARVTYNNLYTLLNGKMACVGTSPNFTNQEYHASTSKGSTTTTANISEYGSGASGIQPTAVIGTYTLTKNTGTPDVVSYHYNAGGDFTYEVYGATATPTAPAVVYFCDTTTITYTAVSIQAAAGAPVACQ